MLTRHSPSKYSRLRTSAVSLLVSQSRRFACFVGCAHEHASCPPTLPTVRSAQCAVHRATVQSYMAHQKPAVRLKPLRACALAGWCSCWWCSCLLSGRDQQKITDFWLLTSVLTAESVTPWMMRSWTYAHGPGWKRGSNAHTCTRRSLVPLLQPMHIALAIDGPRHSICVRTNHDTEIKRRDAHRILILRSLCCSGLRHAPCPCPLLTDVRAVGRLQCAQEEEATSCFHT